MFELKFKVWDREEQEYIQLGGDTFISYDGEKIQVFEGDEEYGHEHENIDILICTGTDESGNEVWQKVYVK